jgi:hypothetical protein
MSDPTPTFTLIHDADRPALKITGALPPGFHGTAQGDEWLCPPDARNAAALRAYFPWTGPVVVGLRKSVGCGDRLGLATPGHLRAVRAGDMFPVLAQQSIREMTRAGRTPQDVMDDATWGVFAADYRDGWGSDADHLKTTAQVDDCLAAGFTGFTLDPGEHVDSAAASDDLATLNDKYAALPWEQLEAKPLDYARRYDGQTLAGKWTREALLRAACKYGPALAHVVTLARHIAAQMDGRAYDLEISVDETETPTSPLEHAFIAGELRRLGVKFEGLAPRFVGDFEKGVDYKGDLGAFERDFAVHAALARELGPYKLSIHSGSDKFSIYPIIARHANPYVHLKTAGTSWLEALRTLAWRRPDLFRPMLDAALEAYPRDRASYHVSACVEAVPRDLPDARLTELLDQHDARQILHVTFGTLMAGFRAPLYATLAGEREAYSELLRAHFDQHIAPFVG